MNNVVGHLTDIKDMVIDQNEWYEEMFYDGSDASGSDVFDMNDDLPTQSDVVGARKGEGGPSKFQRKSEKKRSNFKAFENNMSNLIDNPLMKPRNSVRKAT